MNLKKLFEKQRELGQVGLFNYHGEDRFNKLVLALLVELGECANEWRGFKFWSKDQEPRTSRKCFECYGFGYKHNKENKCFVCDGSGSYSNPLLEEYVDGLHLVLDLGLELNYTNIESWTIKEKTITNQFIDCFTRFQTLHFQMRVTGEVPIEMYEHAVSAYLTLGEMHGFTWEQIEQAYMDKNKLNHERQEQGY